MVDGEDKNYTLFSDFVQKRDRGDGEGIGTCKDASPKALVYFSIVRGCEMYI
jgi:hypothetical protein